MRYILSSFLIEGVTLEKLSKKSGRKFVQHFKETLMNEIEKYDSKGLKSIKVTSLSTYDRNNLIIEFVSIVNPRHHQTISDAIRHALLTLDVSSYILSIFFLINYFCF